MKKFFLPLIAMFVGGCCSAPKNGIVCFTFDDFGGSGWLAADKIFKKYDGHATFFFSGSIDQERIDVMKKLSRSGHSIGLHTVNHANAIPLAEGDTFEKYFECEVKPQLDVCRDNNIKIRSFAYPNNRHSAESDAFMHKYFDHLRAGYGPQKQVIYVPADEISSKMILCGGGIGEYYKSELANLVSIIDKAADNNQMIVFFSHRIRPEATGVDMSPELLEALLAHAKKRGMIIAGADELAKFAR